MKHILIDTNCWKHLLESDPKSEMTKLLNHWISQEEIKILMPEVIKDREWPRMKKKHLDEVKKAHKTIVDQVDMKKSPLSGAVNHAYSEVMRKIAEVDKLIEEGIYIKFSSKVSNQVMRRYNDGLPPFHTKERSNDDGLIYYSSIEFLKVKNLTELIFISNDKKGFSDEIDENKLHPKLEVSGLTILFSRNIHKAIYELSQQLSRPGPSHPESDIDYVSEFNVLEKIPENVLAQLHEALDKYSDQLKFIPTDILRRMFPLKTVNQKYPYTDYSAYSLGTNNPKVIEMISSIEVKRNNKIVFKDPGKVKGVKNAKTKALEVFRYLNDNIVTELYEIGVSRKHIDIELQEDRQCNCTRCSNYKLNYAQSLTDLNPHIDGEVLEIMKHGHVHFMFGSFSNAMRLYYKAYQKSVAEAKGIRAYICFYNLKRIKQYIKGYFSAVEDDVKKIISDIEQSSTIKEIYGYADQSDFALENMFWLKEHKFYNEALQDVTQTTEKIRDHYHSQLTGGWSSNSNIRILITKVVEFERYLNQNYIVHQPSEISEVFEIALDGFFIAHSFNEKQDSRLAFFNDYLLLMMIKYAKSETIYKYFRRYKLHKLKYGRGNQKAWQIETIASNYFNGYLEVIRLFEIKKEKEGYFFHQQLQRITINIFTICALTDVKRDLPNQIVESVLHISKAYKLLRKTEHQYFSALLIRNGRLLKKETIKRLLETSISNEQFHDEHIFDALNKIINKYHKDLVISDRKLMDLIAENFMQKCPKCNELHYMDCLMDIYDIVIPAFQKRITMFMESQIIGVNDWHLFYLASMYEIIDPKKFLPVFLPMFSGPPKESLKRPHWFGERGELSIPKLNELINLSIKSNLEIQDTLSKFKGVSDYYDFIIDPAHFNNRKFKPEWTMEYQTSLFLERIYGNPKIRAIMRKYLLKEKHPRMSEHYIEFTA